MAELKLHDLELSGNCYKIRLFCALLASSPTSLRSTSSPARTRKVPSSSATHLARSPSSRMAISLCATQAILVYLARKYGGERWLPTEPAPKAEVVSWLMVAENEIARGPNDARLHDKFGDDLDVDLARRKAERILGLRKRISRRDGGTCSTARPSPTSPACPIGAQPRRRRVARSLSCHPRLDIADQGTPGFSSPCRRYDKALHRHRLLARSQIRAGAPAAHTDIDTDIAAEGAWR